MAYWLFKSEPDTFGIDDLRSRPKQTEPWDGVRNYQARNMMRDQMQVGDLGFFYHSNVKEPGIVGLIEVVSVGYPDPTAFDPNSHYYDPKSDPDNPRWYLVDVRYRRHTKRNIRLAELKQYAEDVLADFPLVRRANRLSIMPVMPEHWDLILGLEEAPD
ncbi:EVE domain-containing protein [Halochromatium salexigens]|uniref:EVE domain-containing protein n=1 Tax=Halochromatium salexigens TaxID=49447 RepID=A0AAJ0UDQ7_HALSE|nr:EVE domain-containing protein [Halochromatium salexigens]MBK5929576.1 EVE domain-containing protein [Halochromatium salexigens]